MCVFVRGCLIKRERNLCLVMPITGALQNVMLLRVIRKAAERDNSNVSRSGRGTGGDTWRSTSNLGVPVERAGKEMRQVCGGDLQDNTSC